MLWIQQDLVLNLTQQSKSKCLLDSPVHLYFLKIIRLQICFSRLKEWLFFPNNPQLQPSLLWVKTSKWCRCGTTWCSTSRCNSSKSNKFFSFSRHSNSKLLTTRCVSNEKQQMQAWTSGTSRRSLQEDRISSSHPECNSVILPPSFCPRLAGGLMISRLNLKKWRPRQRRTMTSTKMPYRSDMTKWRSGKTRLSNSRLSWPSKKRLLRQKSIL